MAGYLARRLLQILVTLFLFITASFFLVQAQPGDYSSFFALNPELPPEVQAQVRANFGLDKPLWQQYLVHLRNTVTGNFGVSFSHYPQSVTEVILERLPRTVALFLTATVVSFYAGFFLGKLLAWHRGGVVEYAATITGVGLFTVFTPWFGLMMIWLFGFKLDWLPLGKFLDPLVWRNAPVTANQVFAWMLITASACSVLLFLALLAAPRLGWRLRGWPLALGVGLALALVAAGWNWSGAGYLALDILKHLALPVVTLTLISFAGTMLLTRNSMLETLREDYIMAARAKGLPEKVVRDRHAARNALLPVVTSLVFSLAFAVDGGVITESVFSWPGMGMTLLDAVLSEDLPLALGALSFVGGLALVAHVVAGVLYVYLDPRVHYQ